eukprot:scaffold27438_cov108-Isochrysis_galbana.AAC.2
MGASGASSTNCIFGSRGRAWNSAVARIAPSIVRCVMPCPVMMKNPTCSAECRSRLARLDSSICTVSAEPADRAAKYGPRSSTGISFSLA